MKVSPVFIVCFTFLVMRNPSHDICTEESPCLLLLLHSSLPLDLRLFLTENKLNSLTNWEDVYFELTVFIDEHLNC